MKLKLSGFLSDGAVLQKDERIPVRGMGTPGKRVRAVLKKSAAMTLCAGFHSGENVNSGEAVTEGETVASGETVVPGDGRFCLELDPLPAGGPYELCVTEEENSVTVSDLLIGAVWYVSGQSNIDVDMERCRAPIRRSSGAVRMMDFEPSASRSMQIPTGRSMSL